MSGVKPPASWCEWGNTRVHQCRNQVSGGRLGGPAGSLSTAASLARPSRESCLPEPTLTISFPLAVAVEGIPLPRYLVSRRFSPSRSPFDLLEQFIFTFASTLFPCCSSLPQLSTCKILIWCSRLDCRITFFLQHFQRSLNVFQLSKNSNFVLIISSSLSSSRAPPLPFPLFSSNEFWPSAPSSSLRGAPLLAAHEAPLLARPTCDPPSLLLWPRPRLPRRFYGRAPSFSPRCPGRKSLCPFGLWLAAPVHLVTSMASPTLTSLLLWPLDRSAESPRASRPMS